MELIKKYKTYLIALAVVLVGGLAYMYFRGDDASTGSELTYDDTSSTDASFTEGQEILSQLDELRRLKIDKTFFDNSVFKSLVDQRPATTSEPIGRSDPFEALPKEQSDAGTSASAPSGFIIPTKK